MFSSELVTFERQNPDGTSSQIANILVSVSRADMFGHLLPYAAEYDWVASLPLGLVYPQDGSAAAGTPIQAGDAILWSQLTNSRSTVYKPRIGYGLLARMQLFFHEVD